MEHAAAREFVSKVASLWKAQQRRAFLYKEALKKDNVSSLRKTLSQGYFSALLFQKEIQGVYDYVKCLLTDEDLEKQGAEVMISDQLSDTEEESQIVNRLITVESTILESYHSLEGHLEYATETKSILSDHLERISDFYRILSKYQREHTGNLPIAGAA
ncbi:hypothetical protein DSL64_23085 [Dyadobacter luteus]|uniref:DUF2383 domain-containing protein n=1 Tax=Dyadobacter luteus TaxID=2259619 RepID=A0A3D8Y509_9BACT|nr:hypothetical protein [Dyadobacter luteus]REA57626.1 hypothetical protein DSL64_23085 [Dyadobacter luteus]